MAEPKPGRQTIYRKPLFTAVLEQAKKVGKVEIKEIVFQLWPENGIAIFIPVSGRWIHRGRDGSVSDRRGSEERKLRAGEAFFEPANVKILKFDNASDTKGMKFIAFYLLDANENELIRMLE